MEYSYEQTNTIIYYLNNWKLLSKNNIEKEAFSGKWKVESHTQPGL